MVEEVPRLAISASSCGCLVPGAMFRPYMAKSSSDGCQRLGLLEESCFATADPLRGGET